MKDYENIILIYNCKIAMGNTHTRMYSYVLLVLINQQSFLGILYTEAILKNEVIPNKMPCTQCQSPTFPLPK